MSNAEYVAKLDEDQLTNLIEQATARREAIRKSGWVSLWVVSIGWANVAWFAEADHASAVDRALAEVRKEAARRPGKRIGLEVELQCFRPDEAADLIRSTERATEQSAASQGVDRKGAGDDR